MCLRGITHTSRASLLQDSRVPVWREGSSRTFLAPPHLIVEKACVTNRTEIIHVMGYNGFPLFFDQICKNLSNFIKRTILKFFASTK